MPLPVPPPSTADSWNMQAIRAAITGKFTALSRFQLSGSQKKQHPGQTGASVREFIVLVAKKAKTGTIVDVNVPAWRPTTIERLVRSTGHVKSKYRYASAQDFVGQTIHYGVFDPFIMLKESDAAIIEACKTVLLKTLNRGGLQVPRIVKDREARLRANEAASNSNETTRREEALAQNWVRANADVLHSSSNSDSKISLRTGNPHYASSVTIHSNQQSGFQRRRNMSSLDRQGAEVVESIEQDYLHGHSRLPRTGHS